MEDGFRRWNDFYVNDQSKQFRRDILEPDLGWFLKAEFIRWYGKEGIIEKNEN